MAANPLAHAKHSLYFWLGVALLAGVQVWVLHHVYAWPLTVLALDAVLHLFSLGLLVFALLNTLAYFNPSKGQVLLLLLGPALLSFLWFGFCRWTLLLLLKNSPMALALADYQTWYAGTEVYRLTVAFLLLLGSTGFGLLWYRLAQKEQQLRVKNENARLAREAELFKLRQQLQPHFLFNSLNSIMALIGQKPSQAREMLLTLSNFFRSTVTHSDMALITLAEELKHLQLYLQIEDQRFGHRLKTKIEAQEASLRAQVPPLIIQPLLENAIKFGLYGTTGEVQIVLTTQLLNRQLHLTLVNPFDEESTPQKGTGFGLKSVNRRLYLLYGRTDLLRIKKGNGQFSCLLKIPQSEL